MQQRFLDSKVPPDIGQKRQLQLSALASLHVFSFLPPTKTSLKPLPRNLRNAFRKLKNPILYQVSGGSG